MSDTKPDPERRKIIRRPLRGAASIQLSTGATLSVRTTDISAEGLGIVAPANPREGLRLMIQIAIPQLPKGQSLFECQAVVIHSILAAEQNGFKIGLGFVNPSRELLVAIRRFID